jgi:hypothetical protein
MRSRPSEGAPVRCGERPASQGPGVQSRAHHQSDPEHGLVAEQAFPAHVTASNPAWQAQLVWVPETMQVLDEGQLDPSPQVTRPVSDPQTVHQ